MDILQDVRGRKIQYIKLIPSNLKDQEKRNIILMYKPTYL
jgi:hypothetical protein